MPPPSSSQGLLPHVDLQVSRIDWEEGHAVVGPEPEPHLFRYGTSNRFTDPLVQATLDAHQSIPLTRDYQAEAVARARAQIMANEDAAIFAALAQAGQDVARPDAPLAPEDLPALRQQLGEAQRDPDYRVIENPVFHDISVISADRVVDPNTRINPILQPRRVEFPLFEIASNPTISLSAIQARRFDIIDRAWAPLYGHTLREMEQLAFIFRRDMWSRILHDPWDFPEADPPPPERPLSLQEQATRDIQEQEDARLFGPPPKKGPIVWHRLGLGEEEGWENS